MKIAALLLFLCVSGSYATSAQAACQDLPRQASGEAPITFCKTRSKVSLRVGDHERSYNRQEYTNLWRHLVTAWFEQEGLSLDLLNGAEARLWLSIPETNPLAVQARLQIITQRGPNFLLAGSPFPETWPTTPAPENIAVTGDDVYPDSFGFRPANLLVEVQDGRSNEDAVAYLSEFTSGQPTISGGRWVQVPTQALDEQIIYDRLRNDHDFDTYVANLYFNNLFEWIAFRERVFAFSWN